MIVSCLFTLLSHWYRNPLQIFAYLSGVALATALWSGVQAINLEAKVSYKAAAQTLGEGQYDLIRPKQDEIISVVDYVKLIVRSGNGGKGSMHLHREKFVTKGGPDGGDTGFLSTLADGSDTDASFFARFRSISLRALSPGLITFTCEPSSIGVDFGSTKVVSTPSRSSALVRPKHAVPSPPVMKGGNSQPSMRTRGGIVLSPLSVFLIFSHVAELFERGFIPEQPGRDFGVGRLRSNRRLEDVTKIVVPVMLHRDFN